MRLAPPPRTLPRSLAIENLFGRRARLGWAVLGVGSFLFWSIVPKTDLSFLTFRGQTATAPGFVYRIVKWNTSARDQIYAIHYNYSIDGREWSGVSYFNGTPSRERVTVEYLRSRPQRSRIRGMRTAPQRPQALLVVLFPLAGLAILVPATRDGARRNRLLRIGELTTGVLRSQRPIRTTRGRELHELTFEFTARDGRRHRARARTSRPETFEEQAQRPLLYDPAKPRSAWVLADGGERPEHGPAGDLLGPARPGRRLILPTLVVLINLLYLFGQLL